MNISTSLLIDMAGGMNRLPLGSGDANPTFEPEVIATVETLVRGNTATPSSSLTVESSFYGSTAVNVAASAAATNIVMINLDKGLYTVDLELSGRFVGAPPAPSGTPDLNFTLVQNGIIFTVCPLYHVAGIQNRINRRFRLCVADTTVALRRLTNATGVGQTMEALFSVAIERNL